MEADPGVGVLARGPVDGLAGLARLAPAAREQIQRIATKPGVGVLARGVDGLPDLGQLAPAVAHD